MNLQPFFKKNEFPLIIHSVLGLENMRDSIDEHIHNEIEIIYFKKGRTIYKVDELFYPIEKESIFIIGKNQRHSCYFTKDCNYDVDIFSFDFVLLLNSIKDVSSNKYMLPIEKENAKFPILITSDMSFYKEIEDILLTIKELYKEKKMAYELFIKARFMEFFAHLYRNNMITEIQSSSEFIKFKEKEIDTFAYIHKNYKRNISKEDLCIYLDLTSSQFTRFFKKISRTNFVDYLNFYRVLKSAEQLVETNNSVTDICYESGFQDLSYFIRVFKKHFGMSPNKYRDFLSK